MNNWNGSEFWKGMFIDSLMKEVNYTSYVELGIGAGNTWNLISCTSKLGVDTVVQMPQVLNCTTDQFFENNNQKYDIIYIDAEHSRQQVLKDFNSAYRNVNPGGIVLLHDVCPNTIHDTAPTGCGDAYVTWMNICEFVQFNNVYTISETIGGGCPGNDTLGIVIKDDSNVFLENMKSYTYEEFDRSKYIHKIKISYKDLVEKLK